LRRYAIFSALAVLGSLGAALWAAKPGPHAVQHPPAAGKGLAVVELFQSQGCSDCPPAQAYLNSIAEEPNVLALSYGVTYWDQLGWKDSFAAPQFTQRQRDYSDRNNGAGVATPQFWINGRETVLGANNARVAKLIGDGGPTRGPTLFVSGPELRIGASTATRTRADVWLVRYDPRTIAVAICAGENGGRTIPHRDIVRELVRIGRWSGRPETIRLPAAGPAGLRSAILVQAGKGGPILAAAKL
jgi:hypothetical protein